MPVAAAELYSRPHEVWEPHQYQKSSVMFLHAQTSLNPAGKGGGGLFLDCGMGKTAIVLEWIKQLKEFCLVNRVLVVSPIRPMYNVWPYEIVDWTNFRSLSYSTIHGSPGVRKKRMAVQSDIHLINREGLPWLAKQVEGKKTLPWQAIILDESTSFKNWSAARTKALRKLIPRIPYRVLMTGTPTPKNLADLYAQIWMLDEGEALGDNVTRFREEFCYQVGSREEGNYQVFEEKKAILYNRISHLVLRLDQKDYLSVPPVTVHDVAVELPGPALRHYEDMERDMFIELEHEGNQTAINAAAKYNACRQISNGGIYGMNRIVHEIHDAKVEACLDIIEELQGKPVLIAYPYQHDADRLAKAIKGLNVIRSGMKAEEHTKLIDGWNAGTLKNPHMAVQPKCWAEGVNLQYGPGRDIIWFGPTDSLLDYLQFNARVWRQGVSSPVRIHRLACRDTLDTAMWQKLDAKEDVQSTLLEFLRSYARKKRLVV